MDESSERTLAGAVTVDERGGAATGVSIVQPLAEGDRINSNDKAFRTSFPYVALPHAGAGKLASSAVARAIDNACPSGVITEDGFTDVPASNGFEAAIDCVAYWNIANGTSATTYSPSETVTRGQMAAFIARLVVQSGGSLPGGPPDAFSDDNGSSFEDEINRLAAAGIVTGRADGTFGVNQVVNRGQIASFLVRAYDYRAAQEGTDALEGASGNGYFADDDNAAAESDIDKAARAGFAQGNADGTYNPSGAVRRDQMAAYLSRVLDLAVFNGFVEVP